MAEPSAPPLCLCQCSIFSWVVPSLAAVTSQQQLRLVSWTSAQYGNLIYNVVPIFRTSAWRQIDIVWFTGYVGEHMFEYAACGVTKCWSYQQCQIPILLQNAPKQSSLWQADCTGLAIKLSIQSQYYFYFIEVIIYFTFSFLNSNWLLCYSQK